MMFVVLRQRTIAGFRSPCRNVDLLARRGQEQTVVRVAEHPLAPQRRDKFLGQSVTGKVDRFISDYRNDDNLSELR